MAHVMIHGTIKPMATGDPVVQVLIEEKVPLVPTGIDAFSEVDYEAMRVMLSVIAEQAVTRMLEQVNTIEAAEQTRRAIPRARQADGQGD